MLSCKPLKGAQAYEVLAKELETMIWVFEIENKIVNTLLIMAPTLLRYLMLVKRQLKLLKKKPLMKKN